MPTPQKEKEIFRARPDVIAARRQAKIRELEQLAERCLPASRAMWARAPAHVRKVSGHVNVAFVKKATEIYGFPDTTLWSDLLSGFRLLGDTPVTGVFQEKEKSEQQKQEELTRLWCHFSGLWRPQFSP